MVRYFPTQKEFVIDIPFEVLNDETKRLYSKQGIIKVEGDVYSRLINEQWHPIELDCCLIRGKDIVKTDSSIYGQIDKTVPLQPLLWDGYSTTGYFPGSEADETPLSELMYRVVYWRTTKHHV